MGKLRGVERTSRNGVGNSFSVKGQALIYAFKAIGSKPRPALVAQRQPEVIVSEWA